MGNQCFVPSEMNKTHTGKLLNSRPIWTKVNIQEKQVPRMGAGVMGGGGKQDTLPANDRNPRNSHELVGRSSGNVKSESRAAHGLAVSGSRTPPALRDTCPAAASAGASGQRPVVSPGATATGQFPQQICSLHSDSSFPRGPRKTPPPSPQLRAPCSCLTRPCRGHHLGQNEEVSRWPCVLSLGSAGMTKGSQKPCPGGPRPSPMSRGEL